MHLYIFYAVSASMFVCLLLAVRHTNCLSKHWDKFDEFMRVRDSWNQARAERIKLENDCESDTSYMLENSHVYYRKKAELLDQELGSYYLLIGLEDGKGDSGYISDLHQKMEATAS